MQGEKKLLKQVNALVKTWLVMDSVVYREHVQL